MIRLIEIISDILLYFQIRSFEILQIPSFFFSVRQLVDFTSLAILCFVLFFFLILKEYNIEISALYFYVNDNAR